MNMRVHYMKLATHVLAIGIINSKINGTPKGVHFPISKLHSILMVAKLLAHNNISINYYVQLNSLLLKLNVAFK